MADPISLGIMAGTTALTAYMSYEQAKSAQEYQASQQKAAKRAVGVQNRQLSDAANLERLKSLNEANLIRSRIRVAAGESGIGFGGTYEALMHQADYDAAINEEIINRNLMTGIQRSNSALQAGAPQLNPILAGILGGLGGAKQGMGIGGDIGKIAEGLGGHQPATPTPAPATVGFGDYRRMTGA